MAPRRRPRQPPELMAELIEEILLRVPPNDPAVLARASAVCKPWCHLLSGAAFRCRYIAFHQTPTLLGFLHDHHHINTGGAAVLRPRFVPTLTPSPFPHRELDGCYHWRVLDCRHGRILLEIPGGEGVNLVVWDFTIRKRHWLPEPPIPLWHYTAAVLCATHVCGGYGHLSCHGGPFLVVVAGFDRARNVLVSRLYSSEAGAWTVTADLRCKYITSRKPSALIGDDVYFILVPNDMVLRYSLSTNRLFIMRPPAEHEVHGGVALVPMEDGSLLGLAGIKYSKLYLWSRNCDPMVSRSPWVQCRVVELRTLIPFAYTVEVVGCAERLGTIIVATDVGVFTVELKTGRERKVAEAGEYYTVFPVMSCCFYTPGCGNSKLPSPAEAH
ncbi:unnamed protein product [Urochloa decumbens]|uniref:F-box domain-containing protein n=1 Tax=Urochloa decumbens TaxID=240449 RepID=A0ABC9GD03_9POAL